MNDKFRSGLLGFLSSIAGLSVLLSVYLFWQAKKSTIVDYLSRYRTPAAISAADHVRGPADASVTVIEYADFQCPFCAALQTSLKELSTRQKFRWVFRQFPLQSHPLSLRYAEASECASDQGKFWEFADALYKHPPKHGTIEDLIAEAQQQGLDPDQFTICLQNKAIEERVLSQKREGEQLWISGTPTFFVNGRRYVGALRPEDLDQALVHQE